MDTEFTALVQAMLQEADAIRSDRERVRDYAAVILILKTFDSILRQFGVFYYDGIRKQHVLDRLEKGTIYCHYEQEEDGSEAASL